MSTAGIAKGNNKVLAFLIAALFAIGIFAAAFLSGVFTSSTESETVKTSVAISKNDIENKVVVKGDDVSDV